MKATCFINCRVDQVTRARLRAVARRDQVSESVLIRQLLSTMLRAASDAPQEPASVVSRARDGRLTVRLQADDLRLLRERAKARSMPAATYLSRLVRAHLQSLAPLPRMEFEALRSATSDLRIIARALNRLAHTTGEGAQGSGATRDEVRSVLRACEALRDHVRSVLEANAASWRVPRE